jgi:hypothetical protein
VNEKRNTCGQAYALTVLTPILEGRERTLARTLDAFGGDEESPLAQVAGTHFARWVVMNDIVYEGNGQRRDHLRSGQLLFTSNFDGAVEPYLEVLRTGLGEASDAVWGLCAGYPGHADAGAFARYLRSHQVESALFFAAYGGRTVEQVTRSLALRREVIQFALGTQGMGADRLQEAFREAFPA